MAPRTKAPPPRCAVRSTSNDGEARALAAYLERRGMAGAVTFSPKDDDELNAALCAGQIERVVFVSLDALLTAIWGGHVQLDRWAEAGVRIELATPPIGESDTWRAFVEIMYGSLARWRRTQRRRQIIMAVILSGLALIAMGVLFFLVPSGR